MVKKKQQKPKPSVGFRRNPCVKKSQKPKPSVGFGRYPRIFHCSHCRQIVTTMVKRSPNLKYSVVTFFVHYCPNCRRLLGKHTHSMIDYCPKCPHCKCNGREEKRNLGANHEKSVYCSFCQQIVTTVTDETNGKAVLDCCLLLCCFLLCLLPFMSNWCKDVDHYCPRCRTLLGQKKSSNFKHCRKCKICTTRRHGWSG